MIELPSASVASILPAEVWFSAALNDADEVIIGATSFTLVIFKVKLFDAVAVPSDKTTVAE